MTTERVFTPIYNEAKISRISALEKVAIEAAIDGDEATVKAAGHKLAEALGDVPRNFRPFPATSCFHGRPLSQSDHNHFILLAIPDLSDDEGVRLRHSAYDTEWALPTGSLQWDGPYSGWIAVNVEGAFLAGG